MNVGSKLLVCDLSLFLSLSLSHTHTHSLNEVLEFAEDIAIDIPKIWDYLGEILSPVVSQSVLSLSFLGSIYPSLVCLIRERKVLNLHIILTQVLTVHIS